MNNIIERLGGGGGGGGEFPQIRYWQCLFTSIIFSPVYTCKTVFSSFQINSETPMSSTTSLWKLGYPSWSYSGLKYYLRVHFIANFIAFSWKNLKSTMSLFAASTP